MEINTLYEWFSLFQATLHGEYVTFLKTALI